MAEKGSEWKAMLKIKLNGSLQEGEKKILYFLLVGREITDSASGISLSLKRADIEGKMQWRTHTFPSVDDALEYLGITMKAMSAREEPPPPQTFVMLDDAIRNGLETGATVQEFYKEIFDDNDE